MNRTVLWGLSLTTLLMLFACSGSDENSQPQNRKWLFTLDGQSAHAGDTIHLLHRGSVETIKWQDENDPINPESSSSNQYKTNMEIYSGSVIYYKDTWNSFSFGSVPGFNKLVLHDYSSEPIKDYDIYVDIAPIELKGKIDFRGTLAGYYDNVYYNDKYIEGPFLMIYIDEELRKLFITREQRIDKDGMPFTQDVADRYFTIKAFGSNRETCYPSLEDRGWSTVWNKKNESDGECYYGKVNYSSVNYWFLKFDYGDYSYEVRKYKGSNSCLWNGEWE